VYNTDTPGFILKARQGEPESTPDDILAMVKELAAPPNRIILFLQQSSVEWCSSLWLHVVQQVHPTRTLTLRRGLGLGLGSNRNRPPNRAKECV